MSEQTAVVFRKWYDGDIIALFPFIPHHNYMCESYAHNGQHGAADAQGVVSLTSLATPAEYADLKSELESIGYVLRVLKRIPNHACAVRLERIRASRAAWK